VVANRWAEVRELRTIAVSNNEHSTRRPKPVRSRS
jgi:hypothetical protein